MMYVHYVLLLVLSVSKVSHVGSHRSAQRAEPCGGRVASPAGALQTPRFPRAFPAPLRCRWLLELPQHSLLTLYFTQLYVTTGLVFTEYSYYDDTYKLGENQVFAVTEDNVAKAKFIQVQSPVLLVEFSVSTVQGTQFRALTLLDVFGFNITYETTPLPAAPALPTPRPSCSAVHCRLLGHCYAAHNYESFFCSCFEGYSGADCGEGPLCADENVCKNGGSCRQLGPAEADCLCRDGFTGDFCEKEDRKPECTILECSKSCNKVKCDCEPKNTDSALTILDTTLQKTDQTYWNISEDVVNLSVTVSHKSELWEGSELILNCTAIGPTTTDITFLWYKDGTKVNINGTTRSLWTKLFMQEDGQITSVLGIQDARSLDSGRWSCVVQDAGRQRCKAIWLTVLAFPKVKLITSALTIHKGENVTITCLTDARKKYGTLGFSWARDRTLLRLEPDRQVWEDLYPSGSVLKLYNLQKSAEYRCQVSSAAGTNYKAVTIWVFGMTDDVCEESVAFGIKWPKTAPGAYAITSCPSGYTGEILRFCEQRTAQYGLKWRNPDYSQCIANSLKEVYDKFKLISYGYSWDRVKDITRQYEQILKSLPTYPGGGTIPLKHTQQILQYLLSSSATPADRIGSVEHLLSIFNMLLQDPNNFLDEEKIYDLQHTVAMTAGMKSGLELNLQEFSVMTKTVRSFSVANFKLPIHYGADGWILTSVVVELMGYSKNAVVVAIQYNNLVTWLPSLKTSVGTKGSSDVEYQVSSQHIQLSVSGAEVNSALPHVITLVFAHVHNYSAIATKLGCGVRFLSEPRSWSIDNCKIKLLEPTNVACQCRGLGTFALFTAVNSTLKHREKELQDIMKIIVGIGGALCFAATAMQILCSLLNGKIKLPVLLKATTAGANSAAMFTLLECDNNQVEACEGGAGWWCAACWCAGGAALCAQPLLLHAELAGRGHAPHTVALLAGLSALSWLTARMSGGSPLQPGAAAQLVCAGGGALLAVLCAVLACSAGLRRGSNVKGIEQQQYFYRRKKEVRHTLLLLLTTTAFQVAGTSYAQPGEPNNIVVIILAVAAIANGMAMLVCYVICDEDCRRSWSLTSRCWKDSSAGEISISLSLKQASEVDNRDGDDVLEESTPQWPPLTSYWTMSHRDSSETIQRRLPVPDCRADIVQCAEYPSSYSVHKTNIDVGPRLVCDLVSVTTPSPSSPSLGQHSCSICSSSNPDLTLTQPAKDCLTKTSLSTISLSHSWFSKEVVIEPKIKPDINKVNLEWNEAYQSPNDEVLYKISNDLDFLLNNTTNNNSHLDQIAEAPT